MEIAQLVEALVLGARIVALMLLALVVARTTAAIGRQIPECSATGAARTTTAPSHTPGGQDCRRQRAWPASGR